MRNNQFIHFIKFSGVSIFATILEYVLFFFLTPLLCRWMNQTIADGLSTALCYLLATILCYVLNKLFVFKTKGTDLKEAFKFFAVATPKMLITTFLVPAFIALLNTDTNIIKTLINICIQTVLFFVGYLFQKIWVFNKNNTRPEES